MKGEKALHTCDNSTGTESGDEESTPSTQQKGANLRRFNSLYDDKLQVQDLDTMVVNPKKISEL